MKRKGILVVILILFIICLAAASVGYFQSKQKVDTPPIDQTEVIKYVYYLEDVEVTKDQITNNRTPEQTETSSMEIPEDQFVFSSSSCTNGVTGDFDKETWEFVPSVKKESTCKLYFNKAYYDITLTITNGELDSGVDTKIKREQSGTFAIKPYDGYEFDTYNCSNNKEIAWDKVNNKVSINAVMEDVACKIVFKVKTLKMDLTVINGTGNSTETAEYGKSISAIVAPNTGYESPTIKCTNEQTPTFTNNTITIEKLTSDTACTITYTPVKVEEYTLEIKDSIPFSIKVTSGSMSQKVKKGDVGSFTLTPDSGYSIKNISCYKTGALSETVTPSIQDNSDGSKTYSFIGMSKNISCEVTAE